MDVPSKRPASSNCLRPTCYDCFMEVVAVSKHRQAAASATAAVLAACAAEWIWLGMRGSWPPALLLRSVVATVGVAFFAWPLVYGVSRVLLAIAMAPARTLALAATTLTAGAVLQQLIVRMLAAFRSQLLLSMLLAFVAVCAAVPIAALATRATRYFQQTNERIFRFVLRSHLHLGLLLSVLGTMGLYYLHKSYQEVRLALPWRLLLTATAMSLGAMFAAPRVTVRAWPWVRNATFVGAALAAITLIVAPRHDVRFATLVEMKSPYLFQIAQVLRNLSDVDRDGVGFVLGGTDCAPFDKARFPGAGDKTVNGVDENCDTIDGPPPTTELPTGAASWPPLPAGTVRPWNVLLITIDTMGFAHTTMSGYRRDTTPVMADLAKRGTLFPQARATSAGTLTSIPAILTSNYINGNLPKTNYDPKDRLRIKIADENITLAELFKQAGYATKAIVTHVYFNNWGFEQGFDDYDTTLSTKGNFGATSPQVTEKAVTFIGAQQQNPWFLWAHYFDPHAAFLHHAGETSYGTRDQDKYDGEIHFTDKYIGILFDEIRSMGHANNTIVIITADHGEEWGEHGGTSHLHSVYEELIRVPFIVYVPGTDPHVVNGAVSILDVLPTLAHLCGLDGTALRIEGRSLAPQITGEPPDLKRVVFAETFLKDPQRTAVTQDAKYIERYLNGVVEFYDLVNDPKEKFNLAASNPPAMAPLKAAMDAWAARLTPLEGNIKE